MHAVDRIAWKALEEAVREHSLGASPAFFGGLEDQVYCASEIFVLGQLPCSPKQHCGVAIMAASMHAARIHRCIGETRLLGQREGVHVGAQADSSLAWQIALNRANDTRAPNPYGRRDAPCAQTLGHERGGSVLFQAQFRMGVKITAESRQFQVMRASTFK
jgi:hypothetical protein